MPVSVRRRFVRLLAKGQRINHAEKSLSALGGFVGILGVLQISGLFLDGTQSVLIVASMGASAVLLFAVPHGPLSQPWSLVGGQALSAIIGVTCAQWIGEQTLAAAVAVGLAIGVMHYLRCLHPPGGATALAAVVGGPAVHQLGYGFVLAPVLLNVLVILAVGVLFNYPFHWRRYPAALLRRPEQGR